MKSAIKPFKIDQNKLTGLPNFTEISKDPLALPPYARDVPPARADGADKDNAHAEIKAKRPDDKKKSSQSHHDKKPHLIDSKHVTKSGTTKQSSVNHDDHIKSELSSSGANKNRKQKDNE